MGGGVHAEEVEVYVARSVQGGQRPSRGLLDADMGRVELGYELGLRRQAEVRQDWIEQTGRLQVT